MSRRCLTCVLSFLFAAGSLSQSVLADMMPIGLDSSAGAEKFLVLDWKSQTTSTEVVTHALTASVRPKAGFAIEWSVNEIERIAGELTRASAAADSDPLSAEQMGLKQGECSPWKAELASTNSGRVRMMTEAACLKMRED